MALKSKYVERMADFTADKATAIFEEIQNQKSDRAVAIVGGALIEDVLAATFSGFIYGISKRELSETEQAALFDGYGPLATFDGKIALGEAFGLLNQVAVHDLKIIKNVRNFFAHETGPITFETERVADACRHFRYVGAYKKKPDDSEARAKFLSAVLGVMMIVVIGMAAVILRLQRVKIPMLSGDEPVPTSWPGRS